jgi:hypothetical protein
VKGLSTMMQGSWLCFRVKKLLKQVDRLQLQLAEVRTHSRDLKTQLADAADYKVTSLLLFFLWNIYYFSTAQVVYH